MWFFLFTFACVLSCFLECGFSNRDDCTSPWIGGVCCKICWEASCYSFWYGLCDELCYSSSLDGKGLWNLVVLPCWDTNVCMNIHWYNFLLQGSLIISDSLNHNSIVNGARGSGATIRVFQHNGGYRYLLCTRISIMS